MLSKSAPVVLFMAAIALQGLAAQGESPSKAEPVAPAMALPDTFAGSISVSARVVFGAGAAVFDDLRFVFLDAGLAPLPMAAPATGAEIARSLAAIPYGALSPTGRAAFARILAAIGASAGGEPEPSASPDATEPAFGIDFEFRLALCLEAFGRTDGGIPYGIAWYERKPLVAPDLILSYGNYFYGFFRPEIREDPLLLSGGEKALPIPNFMNLPLDAGFVDLAVPQRAFIEFGGEVWSFQLGRDNLDFGEGYSGNLTVSARAGYYDFARLAVFDGGFRYSALVAQLDIQKYLYGHRLDFKLGDRVTMSLWEATVAARHDLQLRFLNPFMIFHGLFAWKDPTVSSNDAVTSEAALELSWAPARGLELYLESVMTQLQMPNESAYSSIPNGLGAIGGARLALPVGEDILELSLEGAYTFPYLYMNAANETAGNCSFFAENYIPSAYGGTVHHKRWVGYEPDSAAAFLGVEYRAARYSMGLDLSFVARGENDFGAVYPTPGDPSGAKLVAPSGIPELTLRLDAEAALALTGGFSIGGSAGVAFVWNYAHLADIFRTGAEGSLYLAWELGR